MCKRGILVLAVLLLFGATRVPAAPPQADQESEVRHVVILSVDGLAASYLSDPRAEIPTIRKLMKEGASAEGMITSFPSVTWPSHVSLMTGATPSKHGVIGNSVWNRATGRKLTYIGDPELTKDEAVRCPTLYDAAAAAGMKSGGIIWPCSNGAKNLAFTIPDSNQQEIHNRYTTPGLAKDLLEAKIDISPLGKWGWNKEYSTSRDDLFTAVARHLLEKHRVNLVLLHLITPDGVEHAYGPHTPPAYEAVAQSDAHIAKVWETLQQPPLQGKSTLFVVSDHGFAAVEKSIQPNALFRGMELVDVNDAGEVTGRRVWCVSQGGSAFIYILDRENLQELLPRVKAALAKLEGVQKVIEPEQFAELGLPHPDKNDQMGDLVLATGPGYAFVDGHMGEPIVSSGGYRGTHGHLPQPDYMHASFVAWGAGIKPGVRLKTINNIDVAPTAARLLGLELPEAEGRVLTEILAK